MIDFPEMPGTADDHPLRFVARIAVRVGIGFVLSGEALIGQVRHDRNLADFPAGATWVQPDAPRLCPRVRLCHRTLGLRYPAHVPARIPGGRSVAATDLFGDGP